MDIIDTRFAAENAADIPAILTTYTGDICWEDTTSPVGPLHGKQAAGVTYANVMSVPVDMTLNLDPSAYVTVCTSRIRTPASPTCTWE